MNVTAGDGVIKGVATANLLVGMTVTDNQSPTAIKAGTTIFSIDTANNEITLSNAPTASVAGDSLTFTYDLQQFVQNQFNIAPSTDEPTVAPSAPEPLQYAQQYTSGSVSDSGSAITLTVGPGQSQAIEAITYNPLAAAQSPPGFHVGAGMTFQVAFSGVQPGQDVSLTVWIRGMEALPVVINPLSTQ